MIRETKRGSWAELQHYKEKKFGQPFINPFGQRVLNQLGIVRRNIVSKERLMSCSGIENYECDNLNHSMNTNEKNI